MRCSLLSSPVTVGGSPVPADRLLAIAAVATDEYPEAREAFRELRSAKYIEYRGKRGILLDTSEFGALADALYYDCDWEPFEIKLRLKHYEGWDEHDWT